MLNSWAQSRALSQWHRLHFSFHPRSFSTTLNDAAKLRAAQTYCKDLVRKHDYENYLVSLFYPGSLRSAQLALRAFNIELASVREQVSNPLSGKMRMQFWRDAIDQIYANNPPHHPVALSLAHSLQDLKLSSSWFKRLVTAREENLEDPQYITTADMETYAEHTASCLIYLSLEMLGVHDIDADHIASHLGKAVGIATMLRSLPFHASQRRLVLPVETSAKHNVSQEDVFRNGNSHELQDAVFEVASAAHSHLQHSRSLFSKTTSRALPAFLHAIPSRNYLLRLEKSDFNVYDPSLASKDWKLPLELWNAYRTGTI
ncbi:uncharacterized protein VTP21DRAFT_10974 [Calcarisporiella thermophila]|uniref:uncharacterized protein n=1 Tax=Calcarisporiella thermophila TaxID=911321 RepID=UPI0037421057